MLECIQNEFLEKQDDIILFKFDHEWHNIDFKLLETVIKRNKHNTCKPNKYFHSFLLRKMDSIFLSIIKENPDYMKIALINLFRSKNHNSQIRFLSDMPSIIDIMKIILYLPKIKFLKCALGFNDKKNR